MTSPAADLLPRADAAAERLREHARGEPAAGLTVPDEPTGERWDWGQVWAHVAEFPPYWIGQIRRILATQQDEPVPFGRVKSDPGRIARIEADRNTPHAELMARVEGAMMELRNMIGALTDEEWARRGLHPTRGVMDLRAITEEFLVSHLEQHADQLDTIAERR